MISDWEHSINPASGEARFATSCAAAASRVALPPIEFRYYWRRRHNKLEETQRHVNDNIELWEIILQVCLSFTQIRSLLLNLPAQASVY